MSSKSLVLPLFLGALLMYRDVELTGAGICGGAFCTAALLLFTERWCSRRRAGTGCLVVSGGPGAATEQEEEADAAEEADEAEEEEEGISMGDTSLQRVTSSRDPFRRRDTSSGSTSGSSSSATVRRRLHSSSSSNGGQHQRLPLDDSLEVAADDYTGDRPTSAPTTATT